MKAKDIIPNLGFALACNWVDQPEGTPPTNVDICHAKWSEDGEHIWFMLETHNFYKARPDDDVDVITFEPHKYYADQREHLEAQHRVFLASRPLRNVSGITDQSSCEEGRAK